VLMRRQARDPGALHGFMRVHYLVSIAAVNVGLVVLFLVPMAGWYANAWLPLTALPYFALYVHDLRLAGYRCRDIVGVYALNLLLVPVNLGGVLTSVHQALTGRGSAFKRTPKVSGRTSVPPTYVLAPALLALFLMLAAMWSFQSGSAWRGVASIVNGGLLTYAIGTFVGWRDGARDVTARLRLPASSIRAVRALAASPRRP
jgi:cellulose synthase (UDP-forming)